MNIIESIFPSHLINISDVSESSNSSAARNAETVHAIGNTSIPLKPKQQNAPTLPQPDQSIDRVKLNTAHSVVLDTLDMMSLLFQLARQARELGLTQRDIENMHIINSQKAQVDEMRHGAKLMIAMAVVSGVMAGFSAIMGGVNLSKGMKSIKQQQALEGKIAGREALVDAKMTSLNKQGKVADRAEVGKVWKHDQMSDTAASKALDKRFNRISEKGQLFNTTAQSLGQMSNAAVQVAQGESQADAKEHEVKASISQTEKQKIDDNMSFNMNFMKDVLQMMQQYSQNTNQTWKAAFGVA